MSIGNIGSTYSNSSVYSASSYTSSAEGTGIGSLIGGLIGGDSINIGIFGSDDSNPELEALNEQKAQAESELGELQSQAGETQSQMISRRDGIIKEQGGSQDEGVQAEYEAAQEELAAANDAKEQTQQSLDQIAQDRSRNDQELAVNSQQQQQVSSDLNAAQSELSSLTPPAQPDGDDPEAQAAYQAELSAYNAKKSELETRISQLQQQQQQLQSEALQLNTQRFQLQAQEMLAESQLDQKEAAVQAAQDKVDGLQQSMAEASPELQNAMDEDEELQSLQEEYEQLQQQITEKEDEISQIDAQIQEAQRGLGDLSDSELAERWANDEVSSDEEKLAEALEAEGYDPEDEEGVIHIGGTDGDDDIDITMGADGSYRVIVNGEETVYSAEEAKRLMVDGGEGDDKIRVHYDEKVESFKKSLPDLIKDIIPQTGGEGDDLIYAGEGADEIEAEGGAGNDTLPLGGILGGGILTPPSGNSEKKEPQPAIVINGGDGNDVIEADENVNTQLYITGGNGDDQITGGSGSDVIIDTNGSNTVNTGLGNDIVITGDGDDKVTAQGGSNVIYTQGGKDEIVLEDNPLTLAETVPGGGLLEFLGGGSKTLMTSGSRNEVHSGDGDDTVIAYGGTNDIYGDDGDDEITLYKGRNTVHGGSGDDSVTALDGNNEIYGEEGRDTITAVKGNNTISGGDGDDEITVYDGTSTVHGDNGDDHIKAYQGDHAFYGDDGNDKIEGGSGREYIEGGDGDDYIDGGAGGDVIYAGAGNDEVIGGDGDDFINGGDGDDKIHGNGGNDIIFGLDGDDELYGDEGEDTIAAGGGTDKVDGGADADIIRYTDSDEYGHDTVLNADPSDDAKALDPIKVPYEYFKIEPVMETRGSDIISMVTGRTVQTPMEEQAARAFENIMRDNLEAFACIEPGQELLTGIAGTKHTVTFHAYDVPNGFCKPADSNGEVELDANGKVVKYGDGSDSTVAINPAFIDFGAGSSAYANAAYREQNTMLIIAHELCHAYNNATGTIDRTYYNNDTGEWIGKDDNDNDRAVKGAELQAVGLHDDSLPYDPNPYGMTENDFRDYFHMVRRDSYLPPEKQ